MLKTFTLASALINNAGVSCNLLARILFSDQGNGTTAGSGNLSLLPTMAAMRRNSITSCSKMTLNENYRIACQQGYIVLLPLTIGSHVDMVKRSHISLRCPQRELNLRSKLQQDCIAGLYSMYSARRDLRQLRRLKVSSSSPEDGAAKLQEVTDNSLEFIHRVALDILAPPDLVWKLWTDIRRAPLWCANSACGSSLFMSD
jgi:hypothetical protein